MGTRRQFSREFKVEAVRLVKDRGVSVAQAARDLDVHENVLRKWVRETMVDRQQPSLTAPTLQTLPNCQQLMRSYALRQLQPLRRG